jgi:hypothetical protein
MRDHQDSCSRRIVEASHGLLLMALGHPNLGLWPPDGMLNPISEIERVEQQHANPGLAVDRARSTGFRARGDGCWDSERMDARFRASM